MADEIIKNDTRLPKGILESLRNDYLKKGEQIIDVIHEAYALAIDFRWIILTQERIIVTIRRLLSLRVETIDLSGLEYEFTQGAVLFDTLEFHRRTESYRSSLYAFDRVYTRGFIDNIKIAQDNLEKEAHLADTEAAKEPVQTLEDLAELKDRGVVSEREFNKAKEEFLKKFRQEKRTIGIFGKILAEGRASRIAFFEKWSH